MEALGLTDLKNKFTNAKNNASAAIDKGVGRLQSAYNTSPLHTALSGGPTTYDNRGSDLKGNTPQSPAPKGSPAKPQKMPKYHTGTDYVPKTGPAVLKKGEAVLNTKEAAEHRAKKGKTMTKLQAMPGVSDALAGKEAPKKELSHMVVRKAKSGGFIHEHHHTAPEAHPMEQHVTADQDGMVNHMMEHMGTPNPGEPDADDGQSGIPAAGTPQE